MEGAGAWRIVPAGILESVAKAGSLRSSFTMGKAKAVAEDAAEPELKEKKRSKKEDQPTA